MVIAADVDVTRRPHMVDTAGKIRVRRLYTPVGIKNKIMPTKCNTLRINTPSIITDSRVRRNLPVGKFDVATIIMAADNSN